MSTWKKFEHKIVAISLLLSPGNDASVWWISGSRAFGESHRELSSTLTVLWMSDSGRCTPPSASEESLFRLFHTNMDGTTRVRATFGVRGLTPLMIPYDPVSRSLGQGYFPGDTIHQFSMTFKYSGPTVTLFVHGLLLAVYIFNRWVQTVTPKRQRSTMK